MKKLRILIVEDTIFPFAPSYLPNELRMLHWKGYPSKSFPTGFYPKKIAVLSLWCSPIVLEKPFQKFDHLTYMNFAYCQSITQFPDVSGAQNLRSLILHSCKKLVKVDGSVGLLPNLICLVVSECTQLKSFVPSICLPSLEYLSFRSCNRLACFPDVVGKMDKPLKIWMRDTAIRDLPHSFANLTGLGFLDMTGCKKLQNLPSSLFLMTKVVAMKIGGCSQLRESLTGFKGSLSTAECWPNLETLHFSNACLSDEDGHVIMQSFPNLKDLNVASNYFVSFPPFTEEFICLTSLDVSYCLNLQEIPELPSSVQKVDARYCYSLTANTVGMLWSQVRKNKNKLDFVMPDYRDQGGIPNFWVSGKFPVVALGFVFGKMNYEAVRLHLHLFIDGATNAIMGPMDEEEEEESETSSSHEEDYLLFVRRLRRVLPPHNKVGLTSRDFSRMVHLETYEGTTFWIKETAFSCSLLAFFALAITSDVVTLQSIFPIEVRYFTDMSRTLITSVAIASPVFSMLMFMSVLSYPLGLPDVHKLLPRGLKLGFLFLLLSSVCTLPLLSSTSTTTGLEQKQCSDILFCRGADFLHVVAFLLVQFLFYREVRIVLVKRQFLTLTLKELAPATLINDFNELSKRGFLRLEPVRERNLSCALEIILLAFWNVLMRAFALV